MGSLSAPQPSGPTSLGSERSTRKLVRELLRSSGFEDFTVIYIVKYPGWVNDNYKVLLHNEKALVVRVYRGNRKRCRRECAVLGRIRICTDVPVPNILYYDASGKKTPPFAVYEHIPGITLLRCAQHSRGHYLLRTSYQLGRTLAMLHLNTRNQTDLLSHLNEFQETSVIERLRVALENGIRSETIGSSKASRILDLFEESGLFESDVEPSLLHGDFHGSNVLVDCYQDGGITGILDFEHSFLGRVEWDFTKTIGLCQEGWRELEVELLRGYLSVCRIGNIGVLKKRIRWLAFIVDLEVVNSLRHVNWDSADPRWLISKHRDRLYRFLETFAD